MWLSTVIRSSPHNRGSFNGWSRSVAIYYRSTAYMKLLVIFYRITAGISLYHLYAKKCDLFTVQYITEKNLCVIFFFTKNKSLQKNALMLKYFFWNDLWSKLYIHRKKNLIISKQLKFIYLYAPIIFVVISAEILTSIIWLKVSSRDFLIYFLIKQFIFSPPIYEIEARDPTIRRTLLIFATDYEGKICSNV